MLAERHGVFPATIAYAWVLRRPSKPSALTSSHRIAASSETVTATEFWRIKNDYTVVGFGRTSAP
jgi:aryl-alcohol dehydrogenase-like predicted oxidoreductase